MSRALLGALFAALLSLFTVASEAAPTITRRSSPILYTDFGKGLTCMYVGYEVTNDGISRRNVWATISGFSGGSVSLAPNENGIVSLGAMAPGESKMAFFYLSAASLSASSQSHTISVVDGAPGIGATLASQSFVLSGVEDTIAANANRVISTVATPNPPTVGGLVTITVTGETGTIGSAQVLAFSPATYSNWRADALQLVNTTITLSGGNTGTYPNTLLIPAGALSASNTAYTAVYNFRIINTTGVSTPISPVGYISSGTQIKHTDTGDFANLQPISPANNTTLLTKTASPTNLALGGVVTYTVRLANSGPYNVEFDRIVDVLPSSPANATYQPGSAAFNGAAFGNPNISGQTLTWTGTFVVPAGATRDFVYRANIPNVGGSYVNRATAYVETTQIDTTANTGDDAPAQATVSVPSADVVVTKTGPTTALVGNTFTYTVTYRNGGPGTALDVVLRDELPAKVSFVSATGGGTHAAGVVTWTLPTIANAATGTFTVTVRANTAGTAINTVASTADSYDPDVTNNDGSAAAANVTTTLAISADVVTTKTGPASAQVGQPFTYTIATTNNGPSPAQNVTVSDTLPVEVSFISADSGGTLAGNVVTWPALTTLPSGATATYTVTVQPTAPGTFTNIARSTATSPDPSASNNDGTAPASRVTTTAIYGYPVSGFVYVDTNTNLRRDDGESGTGLTLFVKVVSSAQPAGPALAAAPVDAATGAYAFSAVPSGTYSLVLDDNATLADVAPAQPAGWTGTESAGGIRAPVAVASTPLVEQNFGLTNAVTVRGNVFLDNGAGGGTANDGVRNGAESGAAGAALRLIETATGTVHSSATSDASGAFTLFLPSGLSAGTQLAVIETNVPGFVSTGATVGNTNGSYARATDAITFLVTSGTAYNNLSFGDLPPNTFTTDGQQSALPGTVVFYPHTFTAASRGTVTFSSASVATPALTGWSSTLFRDANGNGQFDVNEPAITGPVVLATGDSIAILNKVFVPAAAPFGAKNQLTVAASFAYTTATPTLTAITTRQDVTTVGNPTTSGLSLVKSVDRTTARPGETITYTIAYTNNSSEPLGRIVIYDTTPAFTTFVSAANGPLPETLTATAATAPAAGATGSIRWTFTGTLAPGSTGTVSFVIKVDQ